MGLIHKRPFSRGFTLVELMIVVTIIAFVTAAVIPSMSLSLLRSRQRETGWLIVQAVFAARSRAARTGRCHRVLVTTSSSVEDGGNGGAVEVQASTSASECSRVETWATIMFKAVGERAGHAGLVGRDVAISGEKTNPPANPPTCTTDYSGVYPGELLFEATGGLYRENTDIRYYAITTTPPTVTQYVRVSTGGAVKYGMCR